MLINMQSVIDVLAEMQGQCTTKAALTQNSKIWKQIKKLPLVDAVPVVRCKDCKYRDPEDKSCGCGHDIIWQLPRDDNWFCADGKKMADDLSHPFADDVMMG